MSIQDTLHKVAEAEKKTQGKIEKTKKQLNLSKESFIEEKRTQLDQVEKEIQHDIVKVLEKAQQDIAKAKDEAHKKLEVELDKLTHIAPEKKEMAVQIFLKNLGI